MQTSLPELARTQALVGAGQWAQCLALARKEMRPVAELFHDRHPLSTFKAAVAASSGSSANTSVLAPSQFTGALATFADEIGILGRFKQFATVVPFGASINEADVMSGGGWTTGGTAAIVVRGSFETVILGPMQHTAITVVTNDLIRFAPLARTIAQRLAAANNAKVDFDFTDPNNGGVPGVSPPSLLAQGSPIMSASGPDLADARADLQQLVSEFQERGGKLTRAVFIMRSDTAFALGLMRSPFDGLTVTGGTLRGVPVLASDAVAPIIGLVDAGKVVISDAGEIAVDLAQEASLQQSDTPTMSAKTPTPTTTTSLWQTDSTAFKAVRTVNWHVFSGSVYIDNAAYGGSGSPA